MAKPSICRTVTEIDPIATTLRCASSVSRLHDVGIDNALPDQVIDARTLVRCGEMPQRMSRVQLCDLVWSAPLTAVAPQFAISDVALRNTCRRFFIPVPPRGYWARPRAGKPATNVALPARAAGKEDEVVVGGRNLHWSYRVTDEEILGPLPEPPSFSEDIAQVRDRVRHWQGECPKGHGRTASRHRAADCRGRIPPGKATECLHTFSWEEPAFDSPFEQRRLGFLNALFIAVAKCGGKPEVNGREAREIRIKAIEPAWLCHLIGRPRGEPRALAKAAVVPTSCVLPSLRGMTGIRCGRPGRTGKGSPRALHPGGRR
jgi:hypothetical protein